MADRQEQLEKLEQNPSTETEQNPSTETETKAQTKPVTETESKTETESETKAETKPVTEIETESETKSEAKPVTETKTETESKTEAKIESDSKSETSSGFHVNEINLDFLKLGKELGRGSYGTVYQGKWDNRTIAVKQISIKDEDDSFEIEVKQLSRCRHSNIIKILATAIDRDWKYIIMEYANGGSLDTFLHGDFKPIFSQEQGIKWAYQCAMGVAYLHSMKPKPLLHRDVKPANLLLTQNYNTVKICDFGTVADLKTKMTSNRGTVAYIAPEIFEGNTYNEKCDVYSWGILLWEILAREKPFKQIEAKIVIPLHAQKGLRPPDLKDCPPSIAKLLKCCWHENPEKRPTIQNVVDNLSNYKDAIYWPAEVDLKKHFPTIECVKWSQFENLELIDWNYDISVWMGKLNNKKRTIMCLPPLKYTKGSIWFQQIVPLSHKNIISIVGIVINHPSAAILDSTDLISLHMFLHGDVKIHYSMEHALSWGHQCAEGMEYLHSIEPKLFIRCDINPTNLVLTLGALQLKIGNFEIFTISSEDNRNIAYEAPEICEGFRSNEKSDVFSWAIVQWEMLTRQKPYGGYKNDEVISQIITGERPAIKDDWPEPVKELIRNCWAGKPTERPTIQNVASKMAVLVAIVSAKDLQRIHKPISLIDEEDLDEPRCIPLMFQGYFKYFVARWKGNRVLIMELALGFDRLQVYSWIYPCHSNVVSMLGIIKGTHLGILEFSEDVFAYEFLHKNVKTQYTLDHAVSWAQQLAEACAYLLAKEIQIDPIYSCDLLLSNKCRTLKIIPVALFVFHSSMPFVAYIAPEFKTEAHSEEKGSVYGWAIILWEFLARQKPFEGYSEREIILKTKTGERPPIKEEWSESIKMLMENCWDHSPDNRPKMQEVADQMKKLLKNFPEADKPIEYNEDFMIEYDNDETNGENNDEPTDEATNEAKVENKNETNDETDKPN